MPSTILCVLPSLSCLIFTPLCVHYVTICVTSGKWKCSESVSLSVMCNSLQPHGLGPTRLLCLWNSLGKNTGVGSHSLLQEIFLTQGSNPGHPHCRQILYQLSHQRSLRKFKKNFFTKCCLYTNVLVEYNYDFHCFIMRIVIPPLQKNNPYPFSVFSLYKNNHS